MGEIKESGGVEMRCGRTFGECIMIDVLRVEGEIGD